MEHQNGNGKPKIIRAGDKLLVAKANQENLTMWAAMAVEQESIIHCCIGTKRNGDITFLSIGSMPVQYKIELLEKAIYNLKNNR